MTYDKEQASKLYDTLIQDEYDAADIGNNADEFSKKLQDSSFAEKMYNTLIQDEYDPADIGDDTKSFTDKYASPIESVSELEALSQVNDSIVPVVGSPESNSAQDAESTGVMGKIGNAAKAVGNAVVSHLQNGNTAQMGYPEGKKDTPEEAQAKQVAAHERRQEKVVNKDVLPQQQYDQMLNNRLNSENGEYFPQQAGVPQNVEQMMSPEYNPAAGFAIGGVADARTAQANNQIEQERRNKPFYTTKEFIEWQSKPENANKTEEDYVTYLSEKEPLRLTRGQKEDWAAKDFIDNTTVADEVGKAVQEVFAIRDAKEREIRKHNSNAPLARGNKAPVTEANKEVTVENVVKRVEDRLNMRSFTVQFLDKLLKQADELGVSVQEYADIVKPKLEDAIRTNVQEALAKEFGPKSNYDYIINGLSHSVIGMIADKMLYTQEQLQLREQGNQMYSNQLREQAENGGILKKAERYAAEGGNVATGFVADGWIMAGGSKLGLMAIERIGKDAIANAVARGIPEAEARELMKQAIANSPFAERIKIKLAQSIVGGSINLGTYEAASEAGRQFQTGEWDLGNIIKSYVSGSVKGAVIGVGGELVNEAISSATRALTKANMSYAGSSLKKFTPTTFDYNTAINVAGNLIRPTVAFTVETGLFTSMIEAEKYFNGEGKNIDIFKDLEEQGIQLLAMKLTGKAKNIKHALQEPEVAYKQFINSLKGAGNVRFTPEEREELTENADWRSLMNALIDRSSSNPAFSANHLSRDIEVQLAKEKGKAVERLTPEQRKEAIFRATVALFNSDMSWSTKAKVSAILGLGIPAEKPSATGYKTTIDDATGKCYAYTIDANGRVIDRIRFNSEEKLHQWEEENKIFLETANEIKPEGETSGTVTPSVETSGTEPARPAADTAGTVATGEPAELTRTEQNRQKGAQILNTSNPAEAAEWMMKHRVNIARLEGAFKEGSSNAIIKDQIQDLVETGKPEEAIQMLEENGSQFSELQKQALNDYIDSYTQQEAFEKAQLRQVVEMINQREEELKEITSETGEIMEVELVNGENPPIKAYLKNGDINNGLGTVRVAIANAEGGYDVVQIPTRRIIKKPEGYPSVNFDLLLNQEATRIRNEVVNKWKNILNGTTFADGEEVTLGFEGEIAKYTVVGRTQDGQIVFQPEGTAAVEDRLVLTPNEAMQWSQTARNIVITNTIRTDNQARIEEQRAEAARLKAEEEAKKQARYSQGIAGYSNEKPDYAHESSDVTIAGELLREIEPDTAKRDEIIKQTQNDLQTQIDQMQKQKADAQANLDAFGGDNTQKDVLWHEEIMEADAKIADAQARIAKWNKLRESSLTDAERTDEKNQRQQQVNIAQLEADAEYNKSPLTEEEVTDIRTKLSGKPSAEPEGTEPLLSKMVKKDADKWLLDNFKTMIEADNYLEGKRQELISEINNAVDPELSKIEWDIKNHVDGVNKLTQEQITAASNDIAMLKGVRKAIVEEAGKINDLRRGLETTYKDRLEEELANMSPEDQRQTILANVANASYDKRIKAAKEIYGELIDLNSMEPRTVEEYVASNLPKGQLNWEGIDKGTHHVRGLQEAIGRDKKRGVGKDYDTNAYNLYLAPRGEGLGFDEMAHKLWENQEGERIYPDDEIANALAEVLTSAERPNDIRDYILNRRIEEAEQAIRAEEQHEREAAEAFDEAFGEAPTIEIGNFELGDDAPFSLKDTPAQTRRLTPEERELGNAMTEHLESMGIKVHADMDTYRMGLKEARADKSEAGKTKFFVNSDGRRYGYERKGEIYLDPRMLNGEAPIHEYGHLWAETLRKMNPEEWANVVDILKSDADTWNYVTERYSHLTDEGDIAEEVLAQFSGRRGAQKIREVQARMNARGIDEATKSKYNNILATISKAVQDFWKSVGNYFNMHYTTTNQVYDQMLKDFANGVNPRKFIEEQLKAKEAEYEKAVKAGDVEKATDIFNEALAENIGSGIVPFIAVGGYRQNGLQKLAHDVKTRKPEVIERAALMMLPFIPKNAVLIPAPSHTGRATDMLDLANAISKNTGAPVADILVSDARQSNYEHKKATGQSLTEAELGIRVEGELPEGKIPVVIDNVVGSGTTASASVKALGKGVVVSLATAADRMRHTAGLKSAEPVVLDKNGKLIPLSKRFDLGVKDLGKTVKLTDKDAQEQIKYSVVEGTEADTSGTEAGVSEAERENSGLNERQLDLIDKVSKDLNMKVVFEEPTDEQENGWIDKDNRTIHIVKGTGTETEFVLGHELTHQLRADSEASYKAFEAMVHDIVKSIEGEANWNAWIEKRLAQYQNHAYDIAYKKALAEGKTEAEAKTLGDEAKAKITRENILEEGAADFAGEMHKRPELADKMLGQIAVSSKPEKVKSLGTRMRNIITKLKRAIRNDNARDLVQRRNEEQSLDNLAKKWRTAYNVSRQAQKANSIVHTIAGAEEAVSMSLRETPYEGETREAYKLMRLDDDGELRTLFIDQRGPGWPLKKWQNADAPKIDKLLTAERGYAYLVDKDGNILESKKINKSAKGHFSALPSKKQVDDAANAGDGRRWMVVDSYADGRIQIANVGFATNNKAKDGRSVSTFALRPGIHAGNLPSMEQIGSGELKSFRDDNLVWVKGKVAFGNGAPEEALANGGEIVTHIPTDGGYIKGTNPTTNKEMQWYISGAFLPEEIISDRQARDIIDAYNTENGTSIPYDYARKGGKQFYADTMQLEEPREGDEMTEAPVSKKGQAELRKNGQDVKTLPIDKLYSLEEDEYKVRRRKRSMMAPELMNERRMDDLMDEMTAKEDEIMRLEDENSALNDELNELDSKLDPKRERPSFGYDELEALEEREEELLRRQEEIDKTINSLEGELRDLQTEWQGLDEMKQEGYGLTKEITEAYKRNLDEDAQNITSRMSELSHLGGQETEEYKNLRTVMENITEEYDILKRLEAEMEPSAEPEGTEPEPAPEERNEHTDALAYTKELHQKDGMRYATILIKTPEKKYRLYGEDMEKQDDTKGWESHTDDATPYLEAEHVKTFDTLIPKMIRAGQKIAIVEVPEGWEPTKEQKQNSAPDAEKPAADTAGTVVKRPEDFFRAHVEAANEIEAYNKRRAERGQLIPEMMDEKRINDILKKVYDAEDAIKEKQDLYDELEAENEELEDRLFSDEAHDQSEWDYHEKLQEKLNTLEEEIDELTTSKDNLEQQYYELKGKKAQQTASFTEEDIDAYRKELAKDVMDINKRMAELMMDGMQNGEEYLKLRDVMENLVDEGDLLDKLAKGTEEESPSAETSGTEPENTEANTSGTVAKIIPLRPRAKKATKAIREGDLFTAQDFEDIQELSNLRTENPEDWERVREQLTPTQWEWYAKTAGQAMKEAFRRDADLYGKVTTESALNMNGSHLYPKNYEEISDAEREAIYKKLGGKDVVFSLPEMDEKEKEDVVKRIDKRIAELHLQNDVSTIPDRNDDGSLKEESLSEQIGRNRTSSGTKVRNKFLSPNEIKKNLSDFIEKMPEDTEITPENFLKKMVAGMGKLNNFGNSAYFNFSVNHERTRLRFSDHSGNALSIIKKGGTADRGYSIVVKYEGMPEDLRDKKFQKKERHNLKVVEFVYDNPDMTRMQNIAKSVFNLLDAGEYVDLANADDVTPTNNFGVNSPTQKRLAETKKKQLDIIKKFNPKDDTLSDHTWITSVDDIKTYQEIADEEGVADQTPDFKAADMQKALNSGQITVYSSKPIKQGVFVSPSRMIASDYAGDGTVYSKQMRLGDIAWINGTEGQVAKVSDKLFSLQEDDALYSPAGYAVENIKQEKAKPEQWLKMIEKAGGLKKEEDKWIGLSEWLKSQGNKTLTKQEILDYIAQNKVQVEEEAYTNNERGYFEYDYDKQYYKFNNEEDTYYTWDGYRYDVFADGKEIGKAYSDKDAMNLIRKAKGITKTINETRISYTTNGLSDKKEIALTVPTIEQYNKNDNIHFGDAGEGRAVAWVRFGDTTIYGEIPYESITSYKTSLRIIEAINHQGEIRSPRLKADYDKQRAEAEKTITEFEAKYGKPKKVLVIDEIQSKRHQDGRENGYEPDLEALLNKRTDAENNRIALARQHAGEKGFLQSEEYQAAINASQAAEEEYSAYVTKHKGMAVPDAPFRKNWHELAMKRMLRYAAENGYDKIAWTTGQQQSDRYDLGKVVKSVFVYRATDPASGKEISGEYDVNTYDRSDNTIYEASGRMDRNKMISTFGKELGTKLADDSDAHEKGWASVEATDGKLSVGGDGMKGFYDDMLPRFMDKYGKKWGVKTRDIELDLPNEADRVMHSVDVTPEMKESVMKGQPMFSLPERPRPNTEEENVMFKELDKAEMLLRSLDRDYSKFAEKAMMSHKNEQDFIEKTIQQTADPELRQKYEKLYEDNKNYKVPTAEEHAKMIADAEATIAKVRPILDARKKEWKDYNDAVEAEEMRKFNEQEAIRKKTKPVYADFTPEQEAENDAVLKAAKKEFGTTTDFREAGYILTDGSMLDFSEKKNGGDPGRRTLDHRSIVRVEPNTEGGWNGMMNFVHRGNIRIMPETGTINLGRMPSKEQLSKLSAFVRRCDGDVSIEFFDDKKNSEHYAEYEGAKAVRVIADIRRYFDEGIRPEGNLFSLKEEQINSDNFKKWFGDWQKEPENASKVVDEEGKPLTMYHGTPYGKFTVFQHGSDTANDIASIGFWFTPNERLAQGFSETGWRRNAKSEEVMKVYLDIKKPKIYDSNPISEADKEYIKSYDEVEKQKDAIVNKVKNYSNFFAQMAFSDGIKDRKMYEHWLEKLTDEQKEQVKKDIAEYKEVNGRLTEMEPKYLALQYTDAYERFRTDLYSHAGKNAEFANVGGLGRSMDPQELEKAKQAYIEQLKKDGYDGIIIKGTHYDQSTAGGKNDQYITFEPTQIKSATENNGKFDGTNPDIRFSIEEKNDLTAADRESIEAYNSWVDEPDYSERESVIIPGKRVEIPKKGISLQDPETRPFLLDFGKLQKQIDTEKNPVKKAYLEHKKAQLIADYAEKIGYTRNHAYASLALGAMGELAHGRIPSATTLGRLLLHKKIVRGVTVGWNGMTFEIGKNINNLAKAIETLAHEATHQDYIAGDDRYVNAVLKMMRNGETSRKELIDAIREAKGAKIYESFEDWRLADEFVARGVGRIAAAHEHFTTNDKLNKIIEEAYANRENKRVQARNARRNDDNSRPDGRGNTGVGDAQSGTSRMGYGQTPERVYGRNGIALSEEEPEAAATDSDMQNRPEGTEADASGTVADVVGGEGSGTRVEAGDSMETILEKASRRRQMGAQQNDRSRKPRRMKNESQAHYMARLRDWKRAEEKLANATPMPNDEDFLREANAQWAQAMEEWKQRHGLEGQFIAGADYMSRREGESDEAYLARLKKNEAWQAAMKDQQDKMPNAFDFEAEAQRKYREAYEQWKIANELVDETNMDLLLMDGRGGNAPEPTEGLEEGLENQRIQLEMAQSAGYDVTAKGAERHMKNAVIERRKQLESSSAEDALYLRDLQKKIDEASKAINGAVENATGTTANNTEGTQKAHDLNKELPDLIELPAYASNVLTSRYNEAHNSFYDAKTIESLLPYILGDKDAAGLETVEQNIVHNFKSFFDNEVEAIEKAMQEKAGKAPADATADWEAYTRGEGEGDALQKAPEAEPGHFDYRPLKDKWATRQLPEVQKLMEEVKGWYDDFYNYIEEAGLRKDAGYVSDYVNHVWDREKSTAEAWDNFQRMSSPNMRHREVFTYAEGREIGLAPKYETITDMMAHYSRQNNEALANRALLDYVSNITFSERNKDGEVTRTLPLVSDVKPREFDRDRYERYDVPGIGDVWVLKEAQQYFAAVFGTQRTKDVKEWVTKTGHVYDVGSSVMKKIQLGLSGFHALALSEVALAQMNPIAGGKALVKYVLYDAIKKGTLPAYAHPEDFKLAASHLVSLGATQDYCASEVNAMTAQLKELCQELYDKSKAAGSVPLVVSTMTDWLNRGIDTVLWNYIHDGLKIACFKMYANDIYAKAKKNGWDEAKIDKMLDEAGQLTNDTFGGQYWEILGISPATIKWLRRCFLSPDWLISTQRHFWSMTGLGSLYSEEGFLEYVKNSGKRLFTKEEIDNDGRKFRSRESMFCYLVGVLGMYYPLMNVLNAMFRRKDEKEEQKKADEIRANGYPEYQSPYELKYPDGMKWYDYTMLGNSVGQQTHLFTGRYDDGTETYVRWGKQFREFPELFMGRHGVEFPAPLLDRMKGKGNPVFNYLTDGVGYLGVHGFETTYQHKEIQEKYGKTIGFLAMTAQHFLPFSVPTQEDKEFKWLDLFMPSQKGFSSYKALDYFKTFITAGDMNGVLKTYDACVMNGIEPKQALEAAIKAVEATQKKELVSGITDLKGAMESFDSSQSVEQKAKLKKKIMQYLNGEEYTTFTRLQAEETYKEYMDPTVSDPTTTKNELLYQNSEDILYEYKISRLKKVVKEQTDKYKKLQSQSQDLAQKFRESHSEYFAAEGLLKALQSELTEKKKQFKATDDAQVVKDMTAARKRTLETIGKLKE